MHSTSIDNILCLCREALSKFNELQACFLTLCAGLQSPLVNSLGNDSVPTRLMAPTK